MSVLWLNGHCPAIPAIDPDKLRELCTVLKPVVRQGGGLTYIEDIDPSNQAITFSPKPTTPLKTWREIGRIETYHTCGHVALFKPTMAEVLAQASHEIAGRADCYEVLTGDTVACFGEGDGHRTVTVFYQDLSNEDAIIHQLGTMGWKVDNDYPLVLSGRNGEKLFFEDAYVVWRQARKQTLPIPDTA